VAISAAFPLEVVRPANRSRL